MKETGGLLGAANLEKGKFDDLVKSLKRRISVIPAKAGIQLFQIHKKFSGLRFPPE